MPFCVPLSRYWPSVYRSEDQDGFDIPLVDVFPGAVASDKADGLYSRIIAYGVDGGNTSMDDVEDTGRETWWK